MNGKAWRPETDVCLLFGAIIDTRNDTACTPLAAPWRLVSAIAGVNGVLLLGPVRSFLVAELQRLRAPPFGMPAIAPTHQAE